MCKKAFHLCTKEKYEKSLELYQNAMALSSKNIETKFLYASLLLSIGRSDDAKKLYFHIIKKT